ncbi:hypothetical protein HHI36_011925 [Cryptolaemus montrouzieri]|uniref:Uncharacterized protein n=1 Tax=Cryptolaemus montrouzieri TaxID=559131 RepID=A0ABD2NDH9_9CUCU
MISTVSPRKQKELAKQCKKTVAAVEDDMEPLKKALNSLRNRVKAIKNQVPDSGPTFRPGTAPNKFGCIIEKLSRQPRQQNFVNDSFVRKLFSDSYNSSVTSNCESCSSKIFSTSISISSNDSKTNTYRKIRTLRKSSNKISSDYLRHTLGKRRNLRKTVGGKKFNKVSSVRHFGFPEHNFEKCLTLLKKKFKDFESSRRRNVNRNMTSRNGFHLVEDLEKVTPNLKTKTECKPDQLEDDVNISRRKWITNKDRNYKLCFKNEHFNNRSETSLESCSKIDSVEIKKNIFLSKATSSPQLN